MRRMRATIAARARDGAAVVLSSHLLTWWRSCARGSSSCSTDECVALGTLEEIVAERRSWPDSRSRTCFSRSSTRASAKPGARHCHDRRARLSARGTARRIACAASSRASGSRATCSPCSRAARTSARCSSTRGCQARWRDRRRARWGSSSTRPIIFVTVASGWIFGGDRPALVFSEAEVQLLFPAPCRARRSCATRWRRRSSSCSSA